MSKIIEYYTQFDEWGRLDREPIEFKVNWHYMMKYLPEAGSVLDNGAGPGKYSMELAKEGYQVTLTDLTPKLVKTAEAKAKELHLSDQFDGFQVADARELDVLEDERFDASLMLGPMYHLQEEEDRIRAIKELNRVTKKSGIVFVAFMPRIRQVLTYLQMPENWKPNDNISSINRFAETGCFDHADEGRFTGAYYYNIGDIKPFMEDMGFESLALIGSNIGTMLTSAHWEYWEEKGETEQVVDLLINHADDPHIIGASSHLLYIGRKRS